MDNASPAEGGTNTSTPDAGDQPSKSNEWSNSSPQSSKTSSQSHDSKIPESSCTGDASPNRSVSVGGLSSSQHDPDTPESERTPQETKPRKCTCCNPVHVCLVFGVIIAVGSVAMTVCGYMSHQLAMQTIQVGNETVTMINESLQTQIERFKTFGPVLIGFGSFIFMCACVLMCEARDEARREVKKRLEEEREYDDHSARQAHLYALQCEVMKGALHQPSSPLQLYYDTSATNNPNKRLDDVAYADESTNSSPVVLVHGPSLAEEKLRNDSQESNDSEAAKITLLRAQSNPQEIDASSIPTCSKHISPEDCKDRETSFVSTPKTSMTGLVASSPPITSDKSKLERPSRLSPLKQRSVNGPISLHPRASSEGLCSCGAKPVRVDSKRGKTKRVKRGTRRKKGMHLEQRVSGGSESGSCKSMPRNTKSVATQNTDLVTVVNPSHDIPFVNKPNETSHRIPVLDAHTTRPSHVTSVTDCCSGTISSLAPVEVSRADQLVNSRTSDASQSSQPTCCPSKTDEGYNAHVTDIEHAREYNDMCQAHGEGDVIKPASCKDNDPITCKPCDERDFKSPNNNNTRSKGLLCDTNFNMAPMSSMHHVPHTTPSPITYDGAHNKRASKSEVVL